MAAYTTIDDPSAYFQSLRYTGNGASGGGTGGTRDLTFTGNSNMKPDMAIHIAEDHNQQKMITDSSRSWASGNHELSWSLTNVEGDTNAINTGAYGWLGDGLTNGIQANAGSGGDGYANRNNEPFYLAAWKANGGTTTSISESGSGNGCVNACTHQADTTSGLSIITYTGRDDELSNNQHSKLTHGLGVAPTFTMIKRRDAADNWFVSGKHITSSSAYSSNEFLSLNLTAAINGNFYTGITAPDSTHIFLGNDLVNIADASYVCYAWAEKQGFSKYGKYIGNGNSDGPGPFVYTGFRPQTIIIKRINSAQSWIWHDSKWGTKNASGSTKGNIGNLQSAAMIMESSTNVLDDYGDIDILSNGFKLRSEAAATNAGDSTYIFMAWAEHPFVTSTGIPTTAR